MTRNLTDSETRLCEELGLDKGLFMGNRITESKAGARDALWLVGPTNTEVKIASQIQSLWVTCPERFGNSVISLCRALALARVMGVKKIYIPSWDFVGQAKFQSIRVIQGPPPSGELSLRGEFFQGVTIAPTLEPHQHSLIGMMRELGPKVKWRRPMDGKFGRNDITIHIRSGDIFESDKPHPGYTQPPLSFYKIVLDNFRWTHVNLVFENESNPVIEELVAFLVQEKLSHSCLSGNYVEAASAIRESRNLVVSKGSFSYLPIATSRRLRTLFYFNEMLPGWVKPRKKISVFRIQDSERSYLMSTQPWSNSMLQRLEMLNYPQKNLSVIEE